MSSLVLGAIGTTFGGPVGGAIGAFVGSFIDSYVISPLLAGSPPKRKYDLDGLNLLTSTEGSPRRKIWGTVRVAGTTIWASDVDIIEVEEDAKGGPSVSSDRFYRSFAIYWCDGEIDKIDTIKADEKELYDQATFDETPITANVGPIDVATGATGVIPSQAAWFVTISYPTSEGTTKRDEILAAFGAGGRVTLSGLSTPELNTTYTLNQSVIAGANHEIRLRVLGYPSLSEQLPHPTTESAVTIDFNEENPTPPVDSFLSISNYLGTGSQTPDSVMETVEGAGQVPAYLDEAYSVFEDFDTTSYGRGRVPNLTAELTNGTSVQVKTVITDILTLAGLTSDDWDVGSLDSSTIRGYSIEGPISWLEALIPLLRRYQINVFQSGGKLKFVPRSDTTLQSVDASSLGAYPPGQSPPRSVRVRERDPKRVATRAVVNYIDVENEYQPGAQEYIAPLAISDNLKSISLGGVVANGEEAKALAKQFVWYDQAAREAQCWMPPSMLALEPTDQFQFANGTVEDVFRIERIQQGPSYLRRVEGHVVELQTLSASGSADIPPADGEGGLYVPPTLEWSIFSVPAVRDGDQLNGGPYIALAALSRTANYQGAVVLRSGNLSGPFSQVLNFSTESTFGRLETAPSAGPTSVWDNVNSFTVQLNHGTLTSASQSDVLAGTNWAVVGAEIIGFTTVVDNGDGNYTLSGLLRGMRDTEEYMGTQVAGSRFVLVGTSGPKQQAVGVAAVGANRYYKAVATGLTAGDVGTATFEVTGEAMRPFAPWNVVGSRNVDDDLRIEWTRRSRGFVPLFSASTQSLDEGTEQYRVRLYDGSTLLRTVTGVAIPTYTYTADQQTADGITPGDPVKVRVDQVDPVYGSGRYREATL